VVYQYQKNTAVIKVTVLYTVGLLNTIRSILRKSLHVDEISSRSSATLNLQHKCQQHDNHVQRQKVYILLTQLWERKSARVLQTIRTVGFLQKWTTIDDVTKYRGMPVSWYFKTVYYRRALPNTVHPYSA